MSAHAARADAPLAVTAVRLHAPDGRAAADGVVAYATIEIARAVSVSVTVLRDLRGELMVRMPTRRDRSGRRHAQVVVACAELRARIHDAVAFAIRAGPCGALAAPPKRNEDSGPPRTRNEDGGPQRTRNEDGGPQRAREDGVPQRTGDRGRP